jgi:hypothetical protein
LWLAAAGALWSAFLCPAASDHRGEEIRLKVRTLRADAARPGARGPRKSMRPGRLHYLVRFARPPGAETLNKLVGRGATLAGAVSGTAVMIAAHDDLDLRGLHAVVAGELEERDKISPNIEESGAAFIVEFHPDVDPDDAAGILDASGVQRLSHDGLLPNQLLVAGSPAQVAPLARWDEVAYVFPAAPELISGERVAACAGAVTEAGPIGQYVKVSRGWTGAAAGELELRYFFQSLTARLPASTVQSEVLRALEEWTRYARLRFVPARDPREPRTIAILFAARAHGDPFPFDGPGRVLAHTFYPAPPNNEPIAGDMHFDAEENWRAGAHVDLFTVALHEAGHALGLGHSDRPGAVMYPYYRLAARLSDDDIAGVRELYGDRDAAPAPAPARLTLVIAEPAGAVTTAAAFIRLAGRLVNAPAAGAVSVTWRTDRGASGRAEGSLAWNVAVVPLSPGANLITVTAADGDGNSDSRSVTIIRQDAPAPPAPAGDRTAPALRITSPASTIASTAAASITIAGAASDNTGVSAVSWSSSAGGSGAATGTTAWSAAVPLRSGTNTITVRAFDAAGNSAWRTVTVVRR